MKCGSLLSIWHLRQCEGILCEADWIHPVPDGMPVQKGEIGRAHV